MNFSVTVLAILFIIFLIMKISQNYSSRKRSKKKKKRILTTTDVGNVLFNVSLFTAGILSVLLSFGFDTAFGESLSFTQPVVNFLAGVLFIWFAIRNIFYGGENLMPRNEMPEWFTALVIIIILATLFPIAMAALFKTILTAVFVGIAIAVIIIVIWLWLENKSNNSYL